MALKNNYSNFTLYTIIYFSLAFENKIGLYNL